MASPDLGLRYRICGTANEELIRFFPGPKSHAVSLLAILRLQSSPAILRDPGTLIDLHIECIDV
jgi:hypothetical protein